LTGDPPHPSIAAAREILTQDPDGRIRALIDYWVSIHPGDRLPGRDRFDPIDIPALLPNLVLTDVVEDERRFFARLVGTAVVDAFGKELTGHFLTDVIPNFEESYGFKHRVEVAETGLPSYRKGQSSMQFRLDYAPIERVHLPLAADGVRVDMILSMTTYAAQRRPGDEDDRGRSA